MNVRAMAENDDKQSAAVGATVKRPDTGKPTVVDVLPPTAEKSESLAGASEGVKVRSPRKYMRDFEQAVDLEGYNNGGHEAVQEVIGAYDRALEGAEAPKSKEQKEKERRLDALRGMISSIGDASRAVANLIFTNRYAPNMYNGNALGDAHRDDVAARRLIDKEAEDKWMSLVLGRGRARERLAEIDNRRAELAARRKAAREAKAKADEDVKRQRAYEDKKRPIELRSAEADAIIKEQDAKDRAKLNSAEVGRRTRAGTGNTRGGGSGGGAGDGKSFQLSDGVSHWNKAKVNAYNVGRVYALLPEDVRRRYRNPRTDEEPSTEVRLAILAEQATSYPEVEAAIRSIAAEDGVAKIPDAPAPGNAPAAASETAPSVPFAAASAGSVGSRGANVAASNKSESSGSKSNDRWGYKNK